VWDEYFRKNRPDPRAVADLILRLHNAKKREELIACINAALIHGQSQPWMYTVLALEMEEAGRPREEIERVLMSTVDFSAVNISNILYSGAFLARFGAAKQALTMYRQASAVDPARIEPYVLGLRLAREANDPESVAWAAGGMLQRAWGADHKRLQNEAEATARDMEESLRKKGNDAAADKLAAALADALKRDLVIELTWNGKADLDLLVEEPSGNVCSAENPVTTGGGIFVHDGYGADSNDRYDKYVCPMGMPGDYRVTVRHISGEVVGKRAVLRIVRYQGSSREIEDRHTIKLSDQDKVVRITLSHGRLKELTALPVLDVPREPMGQGGRRRRERMSWKGPGSSKEKARFEQDRQRAQAGRAPGYTPIITVIPDGIQNTAMAVISGDRRYVRLTMAPLFSTLTDVQSFSFISGSPSQVLGPVGAGLGGGFQ
jgi:hypothetical protein